MLTVAWAKILDNEPKHLKMSEAPSPNDASIREHEHFGKLFGETSIPGFIKGFEIKEGSEVRDCWPEGLDAAKEVCLLCCVELSLIDSSWIAFFTRKLANSSSS